LSPHGAQASAAHREELVMRCVPAVFVPACFALSTLSILTFGVRDAAAANGEFGGGFIELLLTGSAGPSHMSAPAQPPAMNAEPQPAGDPAQQVAAVAPTVIEMQPAEEFRRQEVDYSGPEAPGTIVIDTPQKFLFLVQPGGKAIRYGVGVGRPGFEWSGVRAISRMAEWPGWTPPPQMMLRRPDLPAHMDGGPGNPLGARALYLGSSLYRIHGTNEPETIGQNMSSGCIRMMNDDVIDLFNRVHVGTKVIVI
jgi:lipoprotein-anchoring transpeptidase ErfK/SrfK